MNRQHIPDNSLEPTTKALQQLSPQSQEIAASLVRQLAQREGINGPLSQAPGLQTPVEGIPLWLAKLKAERYSERMVHMYRYLASRYLEQDPALVSNERKALTSLFRFLHQEGLWPSNPLNGVGLVGYI